MNNAEQIKAIQQMGADIKEILERLTAIEENEAIELLGEKVEKLDKAVQDLNVDLGADSVPFHPAWLFKGKDSKMFTSRSAYDNALATGWADTPPAPAEVVEEG